MQRYGANALDVIANVKKQLSEISLSLPEGMSIVSVYDRSALIHRAIENLGRTLAEESAVVAFICVIFLLHLRSALVAIITLPLGILIAIATMHWLGIGSNIVSSWRNCHRHRRDGRCGDRHGRECAQAA